VTGRSWAAAVVALVAPALAVPGCQQPPAPAPTPATSYATTFQIGHGWEASGAARADLNDESDHVVGTQSLGVTTRPDGTETMLDLTGLDLDLDGQQVELLARIDGVADLDGLIFTAGDAGLAAYVNLVVQGASMDARTAYFQDGQWQRVTLALSPDFEEGGPDLHHVARLRVRVASKPGTAVTLHLNRLATVAPPAAGPAAVVSFTFDDGWASPVTGARPELDRYAMPATLFPIADALDDAEHGYLTVDQLRGLARGGWEVGLHSATMDEHNAGFDAIGPDATVRNLDAERAFLAARGITAEGFAWPLGYSTPPLVAAARTRVRYIRTTTNQTPYETIPPADVMRLRAAEPADTTPVESLEKLVDDARRHGGWVIFVFHRIVERPVEVVDYAQADFARLVRHVHDAGVPVRTLADVVAGAGAGVGAGGAARRG
jgi:peptidoglycan/xylan/chitin deacetylase (PgdA/CDA1 family)